MTNFEANKVIKYCGNCGKKLMENAVFCAYCGFSLEKGKPEEGQNYKSAEYSIPANDQEYPITHQEPRVPFSPYQKERIQPRAFLVNFQGAIVSPKTDLHLIASIPNLRQPLILNIIIGLLSGVAMLVMQSKMKITFTSAFIDSLTNDLNQANFDINEFKQILAILTPIAAPILTLIMWLFYTSILWFLFSIFASDIVSSDRIYKKIATITGWAQIPMILQQITSILMYFFFLTDGEIVYQSMTEINIISGGEIPLVINLLLQGIQIFLLLWSVLLVYYGIKSIGSMKTNPATISMVYGIIIFIFTIFLPFAPV